MSQAGLNVKLKMLETSQQLTYQVRPFAEDEGAVALMIQHGNQAGDAAFTVDQYMLSTGAQSYFGTPEFDAMIKSRGRGVGRRAQEGVRGDLRLPERQGGAVRPHLAPDRHPRQGQVRELHAQLVQRR